MVIKRRLRSRWHQIICELAVTTIWSIIIGISALTRTIKEDVAKLGDGLADIQIEQRMLAVGEKKQRLKAWLSSPDPSSNHNAACKLRQKGTGDWILKSDKFEEWKTTPKSFLWLYGIRKS